IVEGLNQFSRDSEKYDENCHIHSILDNCHTMLNNQFKDRIQLHCQYNAEKDLIIGNSGKLHQVFLNILTNATQAIKDKGEVVVCTSITDKQTLEVSIKDNGEGISESELPKITDPFYTTKAPGEGTGLGLSITYNILQDHRGDITFASRKGVGTTVTVTLPFTK
ncbi:MAG TPA: ATP-binding protein, partial [Bacteroidales bacterium]|nr:ATP-binding protein [Bacteroidales bacterium]